MAVSKTQFINYSRCPRYVALDEVKRERLYADITYEEYLEDELEEKINEILSSMYQEGEEGEEDLIDRVDEELMVMLPYYKKIEELAGKKIEKLFPGVSIYAESTFSQKSFEFSENGIKYLCYIDIYNESEGKINIIEVKATTSNKYLVGLSTGYHGKEKYSIFYQDTKGIYHLKEELKNWRPELEMPMDNYKKNKNKLMDRYSETGKYVYDLALQRMIIEKSLEKTDFNLNNINYYLAVLNHEYVFDGTYKNNEPVYTDDIITIFDFTNLTKEMQPLVLEDKKRVEKYLLEMDLKECPLGAHCEYKKRGKCKFVDICFKHIPKENSSLNYMNNGQGFKTEDGTRIKGLDLINAGYIHMLDIPESWITNSNHHIQREALISGKPYINKEKIMLALNNLTYPIYHLDFETFASPLPRFKGEKCYTQSPFQFSLHIERAPGVCNKGKDHFEFLATSFYEDTREELIKKLCEYIDTESGGTILAQNVSFEAGRLKELSEIFPEYNEKLTKMINMTTDLLYIIRNNTKFYESLGFDKEEAKKVNYYHKDFSGSYSIKKTLPVLTDLSYNNLSVKNGTEALITYAKFPYMTKEEFSQSYNNLLKYCKQDTWAMVEILKKLRELVQK